MKRLYIHLYHGRVHPSEPLEDWGFEGPLVGPITHVHRAYTDVERFAFEQSAMGTTNALAFGLSRSDADDAAMEYDGDLVKFEGFWFGDRTIALWSDQEARVHNAKWFSEQKLKWLSAQALYNKALATR